MNLQPMFSFMSGLGVPEAMIAGGVVLFGIALWKSAKLSPIMQIGALGISTFVILFGAIWLILG